MGMLRNALKSGIAVKALQVARREASKPENQQKVREMMGKVTRGRNRGTRQP